MDLNKDPKELKPLAWAAIFDTRAKMSERIACALLWGVLRAADVIDWLFPVKVIETIKTQ
mgnify:CR=1 FL=1